MSKPVVLTFVGNDSSLDAAFRRVQANAAKTGGALAAMGKFSKGMVAVGRNLTQYVTVPLALAGYASVKAATDFQASMTHIQSLVGKSRTQVNAWSQDILKMAPELGKSPKELADALYFITSSGVSASHALGVLRISAKASAAGLGDTQTVADAVTSTMNAYGQKVMSAAHATDVLLATVKYGKAEPEDLAKSIGRVISPAAVLGVKFNEVGAAIASMTDSGLDAFTATTSLRQIFVSLLKPSTQIKTELHSIGLSAQGLRNELQSKGLLATLQTMKTAAHGNTAAFAQFFPNVRALNGFLAMLGKNGARTNKVFGEMTNVTGATDRAFKIASKTAAFKFHAALSALNVVGIRLGNILLPFVTKFATGLASLVGKFSNLSPAVQRFIIVLGGIAAVMGPTIFLAGKLGLALKAMIDHPVLAAVALLIDGFIALYTSSQKFRDTANAIGHTVAGIAGFLYEYRDVIIGIAVAYTATLIPAAVRAGAALAAMAWEQLAKGISLAANALITFVTTLMNEGVIAAFTSALNPLLLGLAAVGAAVGWMWKKDHDAAAAAKKAVDDYADSLRIVPNSIASINSAVTQFKAHVDQQIRSGVLLHGSIFQLSASADELRARYAALVQQQQILNRNETVTAGKLGLTRKQVEALANAAGLKGTESLKSFTGAVRETYKAAQATKNPSKVAAAGFKAVGNKANDATEQLQGLSDALDAVIGHFLDAKQAQLDYKNDLVSLNKALKKSNESMSLQHGKSRESRGQFIQTAGALSDYVQKVFQQTGSQKKATAAMDAGIKQLQKIAPNTTLATKAIDKLRGGLDRWTTQSFKDGVDIGKGLPTGVSAGLKQWGPSAIQDAHDFGAKVGAAAKAGAGVHSPSTITRYAGQMMAEGFKSGFADRAAAITAWLGSHVPKMLTPAMGNLRRSYEHDLKQLAYAQKQLQDVEDGHDVGKGKTFKHVDPTASQLRSAQHTVADAANTARKAARAWFQAVHAAVKTEERRQAGKPLLDFGKMVAKGLEGALGYGKGPIETVAGNLARMIQKQFADPSGKVPQAVAQAVSQLKSLASKAASFHSGFMDSLNGSNDLTQVLGGNGNVGAADVKSFLGNQLAKVRKFAADIKILHRKHVPPDFLNQILSGGLDNGFPIAEALVHASGSDFKSILKLQEKLAGISMKTGNNAERDIFGSGLNHASKVIQKYEKHLHLDVKVDGGTKDEKKMAKKISREIVREIRRGGFG